MWQVINIIMINHKMRLSVGFIVNLAYASQYAIKELNACSQSAKDFLFALGQNVL